MEKEQGKWIRVTERLPEEEGRYLITGKFDENEPFGVYISDYGSEINKIWEGSDRIFPNGCAFGDYWADGGLDSLDIVKAWMPLPDPLADDEA